MRSSAAGHRSLVHIAGDSRRGEFRQAEKTRATRDQRPETRDRPARLSILRTSVTAAALVLGGSSSVFACPMCFGAEETSMIDGTKLGVMVMLAITFAVQGAFLGFFLYLRKRAKRIAEVELDNEWSELQRSPRTS